MIPKRYLLIPIGLLLLLFAMLIPAQMRAGAAPAYSDYAIDWWTIDGGGADSAGEGYLLSGAIGQPDASTTLQGDGYRLEGGFWAGAVPSSRIYMPLVQVE